MWIRTCQGVATRSCCASSDPGWCCRSICLFQPQERVARKAGQKAGQKPDETARLKRVGCNGGFDDVQDRTHSFSSGRDGGARRWIRPGGTCPAGLLLGFHYLKFRIGLRPAHHHRAPRIRPFHSPGRRRPGFPRTSPSLPSPCTDRDPVSAPLHRPDQIVGVLDLHLRSGVSAPGGAPVPRATCTW